jgi:Glycosyl hydrolase family 26
MKARLVMILARLLAVDAVAGAATRFAGSGSARHPAVHATLTPEMAAYLGVFENGSPPGYSGIATFTRAAGRQPNLVGYFSGWAQRFDMAYAQMLHKHGIIPFIQIDPTDASVPQIAAGTYDEYLRTYADAVRAYHHPMVLGFGHEMNAYWYSWGYRRLPAATFVAAWRHIVDLFQDQGAGNVTWLWTLQADGNGTGPIASWWPGAQYVTWVGIDGYYYTPKSTFANVFGKTIDEVRKFTSKPVLLSETAVGPQAGQFSKIQDLFHGMAQYETLGLVWFDKAQHDGLYHQDWRIEDSYQAKTSFALGASQDLATTLPAG